jgi:hypothetical protein
MSFRNTIAPILTGLAIGTIILVVLAYFTGDDVPENAVVKLKGGYACFIDTDIPQEELERLLELHVYPETQRGEEDK